MTHTVEAAGAIQVGVTKIDYRALGRHLSNAPYSAAEFLIGLLENLPEGQEERIASWFVESEVVQVDRALDRLTAALAAKRARLDAAIEKGLADGTIFSEANR